MQNKKKFVFSYVFFILIALIATRAIYYSFSDGFNRSRIENTFPREGLENSPITEEKLELLKTVFAQPFHYLGKGSQAYAFASQDNRYVLKLFKCYHLKPVDWLHKLPLVGYFDNYRHEQITRRDKKLQATLASYKIARDIIPQECAILYMQIVPSHNFSVNATFTDKIGRSHTINLADYGFVLQRKATLIFPTLDSLIRQGQEKKAQAIIRSILDLMVKRSVQGIQDQDPDLHKNAGIIDDKVYCIDIGGFHTNEGIKNPQTMKSDITRFTRRLYHHLESHPTALGKKLARYLDDEIERIGN